jgi:hypothetical protein
MSRIYRTTDRIAIKIHDITVKISPLSLQQKNQILSLMLEGQKDNDMVKLSQATMLAIRFCLKSVEGIQDAEGNAYQLEFDENGMLSEQCTDDMLNMEQSTALTQVCAAIINGVPSEFVDQKGQPLEGVSFANQDTKKKSKKVS